MSRLNAALEGNLERFMAEELADLEVAVTKGMHNAAETLKNELRADVVQAGLGRRLSNSWRLNRYPGSGHSLGAAATVSTKAPHLIDAFENGVTIRSSNGLWLAIPTESAPKFGTGRKPLTPSNFPEFRFGKLRFVYRPSGVSLLVVDGLRQSTGKRGGYAQARSKRARETGYGTVTVPMFFLVRQVRLKKRLRVRQIADGKSRELVAAIDREIRFSDQKGHR
ncbi:hypothetical protein GGR95_002960 [Sulfitobacter undariae]|uniref:Uncharacterized protein n=1 Tax=Sulfitobacter undariae TaxID=1563671 RepID=A0A7W6E5V7_9RHOB|nr:DUF6441 family protein [Sulfitobacter undariae]MBB3995305.1 hypothetical protein [Sulfitobacter undariae]